MCDSYPCWPRLTLLCRRCVDISDSAPCDTNPAVTRKEVIACYCRAALADAVENNGIIAAVRVINQRESDLCLGFAGDFASAQVCYRIDCYVLGALLLG